MTTISTLFLFPVTFKRPTDSVSSVVEAGSLATVSTAMMMSLPDQPCGNSDAFGWPAPIRRARSHRAGRMPGAARVALYGVWNPHEEVLAAVDFVPFPCQAPRWAETLRSTPAERCWGRQRRCTPNLHDRIASLQAGIAGEATSRTWGRGSRAFSSKIRPAPLSSAKSFRDTEASAARSPPAMTDCRPRRTSHHLVPRVVHLAENVRFSSRGPRFRRLLRHTANRCVGRGRVVVFFATYPDVTRSRLADIVSARRMGLLVASPTYAAPHNAARSRRLGKLIGRLGCLAGRQQLSHGRRTNIGKNTYDFTHTDAGWHRQGD
jgi:hypothetical protein